MGRADFKKLPNSKGLQRVRKSSKRNGRTFRDERDYVFFPRVSAGQQKKKLKKKHGFRRRYVFLFNLSTNEKKKIREKETNPITYCTGLVATEMGGGTRTRGEDRVASGFGYRPVARE